MTNEIAKAQNQPGALLEITEENLDALLMQQVGMSLEGVDYRPPRIDIDHKNGRWVLPDGNGVTSLHVVILFHHKARGLWPAGDEKGKPLCASVDGRMGQADAESGLQWASDTRACGVSGKQGCCPFNEFGTAVGQDGAKSGGKACKETRRCFIVEMDPKTTEPLAISPALVHIPPTSLSSFDKYVSGLAHNKQAPIMRVTILRLNAVEKGARRWQTVVCEPGDKLPNALLLQFLQIQRSIQEVAAKIGIQAEDYFGEEDAGEGGGAPADEKPTW